MKNRKIASLAAVAGLGMALSTTPAMADTTWTGAGDGINWSDTNNWSVDPTTAGGNFTMPSGSDTTVDVDTSGWSNFTVIWADDTVTVNVGTGGTLANGGSNSPNGGTLRQTGGTVNFTNRITGDGGLTEISGGSHHNQRWTFVSGGTLHIIGSAPTLVSMGSFPSWSHTAPLTAKYTLDANGVSPLLLGGEGDHHGANDPVAPAFNTVEVDGIATYLAGSGNPGDKLPLATRTGGLKWPAFWTMGTVDGGLGSVGLDVDGNLELTIAGGAEPPTPPAITEITAVGGDTWELKLEGEASTDYEFYSTTTLVFPGTLVENLAPGAPPVGTIGGTNDSVLTTDGDGDGTVRMDLTESPNFVQAQQKTP